MELFLIGVFHRNHIRKKRFWYCGKKRMSLSGTKIKVFKRAKNGHFPKGLVHDFVQKSKFLLSVFFTEIMPEKIVFQYLWKKRMILSGKKLSFKKGQKMDISKGVGPWILSKNWIFSYRFFYRNYVRKDPFWIF